MSLSQDHQANLRTHLVRAVRESTGLHESLAQPVADRVLDTLIDLFRGERVYFPKVSAGRDDAVRAEFTGRNHDVVCERHDISRRTLYRILHRRPRDDR